MSFTPPPRSPQDPPSVKIQACCAFDDAIARTTDALKAQGLGIISDIDVSATSQDQTRRVQGSLPAKLRLPDNVKQVRVRARGKERIIAPLESSWDSFFAGDPAASDDFLESRAPQG